MKNILIQNIIKKKIKNKSKAWCEGRCHGPHR